MADGDAQFTRGVQDGFDDAPLYRWQDPFHQERYDTGYMLGRWTRVTQALRRAPDSPFADPVAAWRKRHGLD